MSGDRDESQNRLAEALKESGANIEKSGPHYLPATDSTTQSALKLMLEEEARTQPPQSETMPHGLAVGSLSICAVTEPTSWHDTQSESARWLDIAFDGSDWEAVFRDMLNTPRIPSEYPMLCRIDNLYEDVIYKREEVGHLRDECLRTQAITSNPRALEGLRKLILACDEALNLDMGLYFASD